MPKKFRVEITQPAQNDIEEIWTYIARDSINRAEKFVLKLEQQCSTLEQFPQRYPLIPENEILHKDYRHLIYGNYRTIFRVKNKTVYVLRVIHGKQLLDTSFLENA